MTKHVCDDCGYIYRSPCAGETDIVKDYMDAIVGGGNASVPQPDTVAFEYLPGDWVCPRCGAEKNKFRLEE